MSFWCFCNRENDELVVTSASGAQYSLAMCVMRWTIISSTVGLLLRGGPDPEDFIFFRSSAFGTFATVGWADKDGASGRLGMMSAANRLRT